MARIREHDRPSRQGASGSPPGFVIPLDQVGLADIAQVGGKNASLGEMTRALCGHGILVPPGFATTAQAYRAFASANGLEPKIGLLLQAFEAGEAGIRETGRAIRSLFLKGRFPAEVAAAIRAAYDALARQVGRDDPPVAVRSSATAEDLPDASFAGQQESFLNVRGHRALMDACRRCYASLFTDRAISYRQAKGYDHLAVALSIGVQQMVRSDLAGAGVMFSIDTETGFPRVVVINATWGLGEPLVKGRVDPDKYVVFKPLLARPDARPILEKVLGAKMVKMGYATGRRRTRTTRTSTVERASFVLSDAEILQLGRWAVIVEAHYGRPMDIEWAKDVGTGQIYLVQARPETVQSARGGSSLVRYRMKARPTPVATGIAIGSDVAAGPVCIVRSAAELDHFPDGAILVAETTDPDWVPVMRRAAGIVTDHGGVTSHAAIVSRELGVPAVVGTGNATRRLSAGAQVTLSCAQGETGEIYSGRVAFEREEVNLGAIPATRTELMVNLADPARAFQWWRLPAKGVGLARMEFIINALIKVHPMAVAHPELIDLRARERIARLARGHDDPGDYFVERLARGIAKLAAPFHPHPAIVRLSDFKTNEYAHLIGGSSFEPKEENPMLGFRGASRYYDARYREGFALECRALRRVREEFGFDNVIVMVPFCRTPREADQVLAEMARNGLSRGEHGLKVYMMCEIPSNVILAREFARRFDGFSIGSNDLTQLVLGVDRDSDVLAALFDERDEAVKSLIADAIEAAHRARIRIGICGQAPSNHPDVAAFLVERGIDSISLNPDSFVRTAMAVAAAEAPRHRDKKTQPVRESA